jgi:putative membrane protein
MAARPQGKQFWRELLFWKGGPPVAVLWRSLVFTAMAGAVWFLDRLIHHVSLGIEPMPYEAAGVVLGILLVLRTNAGYDRWWEARKLWGSVVNQCRNLAVSALAYGPREASWQGDFVRWTAAFGHVLRHSLRGERELPEATALIGAEAAGQVAAATHMPSFVTGKLAQLLRQALDSGGLDRACFIELDCQRSLLLDHVGGCERILKTPLPLAYSIQIRQLIFMYLVLLPFVVLPQIGWMTPLVTLLVAYPILALDEIGSELQYPFSSKSLNHLPLPEICATIESDLTELLAAANIKVVSER